MLVLPDQNNLTFCCECKYLCEISSLPVVIIIDLTSVRQYTTISTNFCPTMIEYSSGIFHLPFLELPLLHSLSLLLQEHSPGSGNPFLFPYSCFGDFCQNDCQRCIPREVTSRETRSEVQGGKEV